MHHLIGSTYYYNALNKLQECGKASTGEIAKAMGKYATTQQALNLLKVMKEIGIVRVDENLSRNNFYVWGLVK